jgi:RNA polymerase sigma factor (sigma-70 family)
MLSVGGGMPKEQMGSSPKSGWLLEEFLRCKSALSRLLGHIVKPHDIDDILQETFIRACAAAEKTEIRHPRSFMLKTAQNLALNHVTTAYSRRTQMEDFSSADVSIVGRSLISESLESEFESKERFLGFCRAVRTLPPQCRRVFVLRKVYGLTQKEIAEYLGVSESTVEKHVVKGLLMCRASMSDMGYLGDGSKDSPGTSGRKGSAHG